MHKLIISADDFGISPRANRNTRYLMSLGKIDRVGIMVNGKFSTDEIGELLKSNAKIDIHFDISDRFHAERKAQSGNFRRMAKFLSKLIFRKISPEKIESEWKKQIETFIKIFGRKPDGISSHEHVHFFPPFFKVALKLQSDYSIPYIRFGKSGIVPSNKSTAHILRLLNVASRKAYKNSNCISSESFASLDWIENVGKFLENLPGGTVEIACHPEIARDFVKIKQYF